MELKLSPEDLHDYCLWVHEVVKRNGFETPCNIDDADFVLAKLMLVVSEVGEAAEAVRHQDAENFFEELADVLLRVFDLFGAMNISPKYWLDWKMEKNLGREHKHGKVC